MSGGGEALLCFGYSTLAPSSASPVLISLCSGLDHGLETRGLWVIPSYDSFGLYGLGQVLNLSDTFITPQRNVSLCTPGWSLSQSKEPSCPKSRDSAADVDEAAKVQPTQQVPTLSVQLLIPR